MSAIAKPEYPNSLHRAAYHGDAKEVAAILEKAKKLAIELRDGRNLDSPLMAALRAKTPNVEVLKLLLDAGAQTEVHAAYGSTPLTLAASKASDAALRLLLDRGAKANYQHLSSPLHTAVMYKQVNNARLLIKSGATVDYSDLQSARSVEMLEVLLSKTDGKLPDGIEKVDSGESLVRFAVLANREARFVKALLDAGAAVDVPDKDGHTALYWAVSRKKAMVVHVLLAAGANPDHEYRQGMTVLDHAKSTHWRSNTETTLWIRDCLQEKSKTEESSCVIS